jgi:hypothetical protein
LKNPLLAMLTKDTRNSKANVALERPKPTRAVNGYNGPNLTLIEVILPNS